MGKNLLLRLNGLSITVLYEGGGRQQMTIPGPCSGRIQRRKEIPEAMEKMRGAEDDKYMDREKTETMEYRGKHIKGSRNERLKG